MKIEFAYQKLMVEHKLTNAQLNEDAITGISAIADIVQGITMLEKRGKEPTQKTISKIRSLDKWVSGEIMDIVNDTNDNAPVATAEELAAQAQKEIDDKAKSDAEVKAGAEQKQEVKVDPKGLKIESELAKLLAENKISLTLDEVKSLAPTAYSVIFDSYKDGEQNGIKTSKFSLLEIEKEKFTLTN